MKNIENFYLDFCRVQLDKDGVLSAFEPVYSSNFNFAYDVVDEIARYEPERRAMVWCNVEGEERTFTFGEMKTLSDKAANLFLSQGIRKGDRVLLILKRHYQFWIAILALHKIGAIVIPGTHLLTAKDFLYRFQAADISSVVCTGEGEVTQFIEKAQEKYSGITSRFIARGEREGWISFDKALEQSSPELVRQDTMAEDTMLLYFTSGTTGQPKMVCHDFTYPLGHIITAKYWHNIPADGLHLTVSETGWGKAMWGKLYGQWILGATVFVYDFDKFVPGDLLKIIEKYKVTSFCAPPTIYRFLVKEGMEGYDLSSIKYATTAGEALNPEIFRQFKEATGLEIMEAFGQTETTVLLGNYVGTRPRTGALGRPSPLYHVDLVDDNDQPVPQGEVGEIVVRTPEGKKPVGMFKGYYDGPERTAEVWYNSVYHTGDTAWRDEDDYYWYVGRKDDVFKSSGYRIGPFEIESVMLEHPAVLECAITAAPDPVRGTVVKATVVLTKNYQPSQELVKELQDYVKHQTAPYKYPRIVEFVSELPKTISGKIRRVVIREETEKAMKKEQSR